MDRPSIIIDKLLDHDSVETLLPCYVIELDKYLVATYDVVDEEFLKRGYPLDWIKVKDAYTFTDRIIFLKHIIEIKQAYFHMAESDVKYAKPSAIANYTEHRANIIKASKIIHLCPTQWDLSLSDVHNPNGYKGKTNLQDYALMMTQYKTVRYFLRKDLDGQS